MVKIKNTLASNINVVVIKEVTTTLAPGQEQTFDITPEERVEIQPTP